MNINIVILGLIFDIIGVGILTLVAIFDYPHTKIYEKEKWWKRYWWMGWRPLFKITLPSGKVERKIKWIRKIIVYGILPPNNSWNIIGFLCILIGFLLQLKVYLT